MEDETSRTTRGVLSRCGVYELVREINRGGTGSVWEGRHVALGRRVAVKVLHTEAAANPEMVARFEREGMAAARIKHPNVAQMLDVGHDDSRLWLVMEFLEGEDMDEMLQREAPLAPERAAELLLPVIAAMSSAHKSGVVHRDLKPGNIFLALDAEGNLTPKIVDFGFSKVQGGDDGGDALTKEDTALGTLSYMPMEQLMAAAQAPPASDQYALGVTLYRAVTGRLPFLGDSRYDTFKAMSKGVFPAPRELRPGLPEGLDAVILRAMARTPEGRYPTMREFGAALLPFAGLTAQSRWARAFGVTPSAPPSDTPSPLPPRPSTPPPGPDVPRASAVPRVSTAPHPPRTPTLPRISTAPQVARPTTQPRISTVPQLQRVSTPAPQPARVSTPAQPRPSAPARVSTPPQPRPAAPPRVTTAPQPAPVVDPTPPPRPAPQRGFDALVIAVMVVAVVAVALALR